MKKLLLEIGIFTAAVSGVFAFDEESSDSVHSQQYGMPIGVKKPSFFPIVDSIQSLMPLKNYAPDVDVSAHLQIWPKEKSINWEGWRQHIKRRSFYTLILFINGLSQLIIGNGLVNLAKGTTPYPNSYETWKKFFTDAVHFSQNRKELNLIQSVRFMRESLSLVRSGDVCHGTMCNRALEWDLMAFLQGTLIGGIKMGLLYAVIQETLRTVFTHLNLKALLSFEWTSEFFYLGKNCLFDLLNWSLINCVLIKKPASLKEIRPFFHSKNWNIYILLNSFRWGIVQGALLKNSSNSWDFFKERVMSFIEASIVNWCVIGLKKGTKYAALQFGLAEFCYRLLSESSRANFRRLY